MKIGRLEIIWHRKKEIQQRKCKCGNSLDEYAIVGEEKVCIPCVKKLGYI